MGEEPNAQASVRKGRAPVTRVGRYAMFGEIAAGGMATIHLGRLLGPAGFSRTVAIKRLHAALAKDPEFVTMFLDEARLAARIRHPNVVSPIDIVATKGELFLVMDFVQGESLARLVRAAANTGKRIPVNVTLSILSGVLHGLHAAHEAKSERGEPLGIVHRDVSPQNVLVGVDGVARVLDFGIAKAAGRASTTREGQIKGKLSYMAPETLQNSEADRKSDTYAASVVLWEALTGERLFRADTAATTLARLLTETVVRPSHYAPNISAELDAIVLRGLSRDPAARFATAREMALALEASGPLVSSTTVGEFVSLVAHNELAQRAERIAEVEQANDDDYHRMSGSSNPPPATHSASPPSDLPTIVETGDVRSYHVPMSSHPPPTAPSGSPPGDIDTRAAFLTVGLPGPLRNPATLAAGLIGLLSLLVIGFLFANRSRAVEVHATQTTSSVSRASVIDLPRSTRLALPPPVVPLEATAAVEEPATVASVALEPLDVRQAAVPKASVGARATKSLPSKSAAHADCDPPYMVDPVGHRHYKDECL
jgi:eukaryotic-like serine/threonine-protein kinase